VIKILPILIVLFFLSVGIVSPTRLKSSPQGGRLAIANPYMYGFFYLLPFQEYYLKNKGDLFLNDYNYILEKFSKAQKILESYDRSIEANRIQQIVKQYKLAHIQNGQRLSKLCKNLQKEAVAPNFRIPHDDFCQEIFGYVEGMGELLCLFRTEDFDIIIPENPMKSEEGNEFEIQLINATKNLIIPLINQFEKERATECINLTNLSEITRIIDNVRKCVTPWFHFKKLWFFSTLENLSQKFSNAQITFLEKFLKIKKRLDGGPLTDYELNKIRSLRVILIDDGVCGDLGSNISSSLGGGGTQKNDNQKFKEAIAISTAINGFMVQQSFLSFSAWDRCASTLRKLFDRTLDLSHQNDVLFTALIPLWNLKIKDPVIKPSRDSLILTPPKGLPMIFLHFLKEKGKEEEKIIFYRHYLLTNCLVWYRYSSDYNQNKPTGNIKIKHLKTNIADSEFLNIYNSFLIAYFNCVIEDSLPLTFPLYKYNDLSEDKQLENALYDFALNILQFVGYGTQIPKCLHDLAIIHQRLAKFYHQQGFLANLAFLEDTWTQFFRLNI
jgi:hypothetical protein